MRAERFALCVIATLSGGTSAYPSRAAVAQERGSPHATKSDTQSGETNTPPPAVAAAKKGTAHIVCIYMIYLTLEATIETCYPNKYAALHKHVTKWIAILREYSDKNAFSDKTNLNSPDIKIGFENYRKQLDTTLCKKTEDFTQQFSRILSDNPEKLDKSLEQSLQATDRPGENYGCL